MAFKIKTSKKTMSVFEEISASTNYAPFVLAKLAISMSIKSKEVLKENDFRRDTNGLELNRQTITGEWDCLYKCAIEVFENRSMNDEEYFQTYLRAHLNRGAQMIYGEFKYNKDFLLSMLQEEYGL